MPLKSKEIFLFLSGGDFKALQLFLTLRMFLGRDGKKVTQTLEIKNATPLRKMLGVGTDWRV